MQIYFFQTESDAKLVGDQLWGCELEGNRLIFLEHCDRIAVRCAINLAGVKQYEEGGESLPNRCHLPFPKQQRTAAKDVPQIYVRCLAAYNQNLLHGLWIDASQDAWQIKQDIEWLLSWSPVRDMESCQEWAIHACENFGDFHVHEWGDLEKISQCGLLLSQVEEHELDAAFQFIEWARTTTVEISLEEFRERLIGHYDDIEEFAQSDYVLSLYNFAELEAKFPFWAERINWRMVANELQCGCKYEFCEAEPHGIYVFNCG